jgi:hypothetical protein
MTRSQWRPRLAVPVAVAGALLLGGYAAALELGIGQAARAAAVTPPEFRQLQALGLHTPRSLGLALAHDDWTKVLLPDAAVPYDGSFGANVRPGYGFAGIIDMDAIAPGALKSVDWIIEPRFGGTSFPPRPFRPAMGSAAYRLWTRALGSAAPGMETIPLERHDTVGGLTLAPGASVVAPASGLLEGRAADGTLSFPVQWNLPGTAWGPWVANPTFVVSAPSGGRPARTTFEVGAGGRYQVSLIGQPTFHMRIRIDGENLPAPDLSAVGTMRYARVGIMRLAPGRHSLALVAGGRGEVAYILAISVDLVGQTAPVIVCVDGRRERLAAARPVKVQRGQRVAACGGRASFLDRIDS